MASRVWQTPVGRNLVSITGNSWQIAGILIDNPSGSWLRVTDINQFVPPYTNGWSYPLRPTIMNLSVLFVDSPSGTVSELVGGPVQVTLFDIPVPNFQGYASGASSQIPDFGVMRLYALGFSAGETLAGPTALGLALPGKRITPTRFYVVPIVNGADGKMALRTTAIVQWCDSSQFPIFNQAVSPPTPVSDISMEPGALDHPNAGTGLTLGGDIYFSRYTFPGGGSSLLYMFMQYHYRNI